MIIKIEKAVDEKGYFFDIYRTAEDFENDRCEDGGHCTGGIEDTLQMAGEMISMYKHLIS